MRAGVAAAFRGWHTGVATGADLHAFHHDRSLSARWRTAVAWSAALLRRHRGAGGAVGGRRLLFKASLRAMHCRRWRTPKPHSRRCWCGGLRCLIPRSARRRANCRAPTWWPMKAQAEDLNAWHSHYIADHPPIMARFPGIRQIEIYTRIDWCGSLPWPRVEHMQRNKVVFDSPAALTAALNSPVRHEMRAAFARFPRSPGRSRTFPWRR